MEGSNDGDQYEKGLVGAATSKTYALGRKLGEGGFSKVYHAVRQQDRKEFALKVLCSDSAETSFRCELAALDAFRKAGGCPFVVMLEETMVNRDTYPGIVLVLELCDMTLEEFRAVHKLPEEVLMEFTRHLMTGIAFCHDHGFTHNDLHLQNILVSIEKCALKLTDFGIADPISTSIEGKEGPGEVGASRRPTPVSGEVEVACELAHAAKLVIEMWLMRACCDLYLRFSKEFDYNHLLAIPMKITYTALFTAGPVVQRFGRFRRQMAEWAEGNERSEPNLIEKFCQRVLNWAAVQRKCTAKGNGVQIPQIFVDECLLRCYPVNEDSSVSARSIADTLDSAITPDTRESSRMFFQSLCK